MTHMSVISDLLLSELLILHQLVEQKEHMGCVHHGSLLRNETLYQNIASNDHVCLSVAIKPADNGRISDSLHKST